MKTQLKLLTLSASLVACGLGMTTNANAAAYAYASNNIKDGFIQPLVNGVQNFTGPISITPPGTTSSTSATLTGTTGAAGSIGGTNPDSPISTVGSTAGRLNETMIGASEFYAQTGVSLTNNYSWGDARVVSEQTSATTRIVARNAAETNIGTIGLGTADGTNASSTLFSLSITAGTGCDTQICQIDFSFLADPYIFATLTGGELPNPASFARGTITFDITLAPIAGSTSSAYFSWAPNGVVDTGIIGGTETLDGENLNVSAQALVEGTFGEHSGALSVPVRGAYDAVGDYSSFQARTGRLDAGAYTLTLRAVEKTEAQRAVPEPASLGLVGLALAGLAFVGRRRKLA